MLHPELPNAADDPSTLELFQATLEGLRICRIIGSGMDDRRHYTSNDAAARKSLSALGKIIAALQAELVRAEAQGIRSTYETMDSDGTPVEREFPALEVELDPHSMHRDDLSLIEDALLEFAYGFGQQLCGPARWVSTDRPDIQRLIGAVAAALKTLLRTIGENNAFLATETISPIERAQLIALLEAALAELKAPYLDRSRWTLTMRSIRRVVGKAIESAAGSRVEAQFEQTLDAGEALDVALRNERASTDLPFL